MEYMMMPYRKLYRLIEGRSGRQEFWMFFLFNILVVLGLVLLVFLFAGGLSSLDPTSALMGTMAGAGVGFAVLLIIPVYAWAILTGVASTAVSIRRLHDMNLTGWLYLVYLILMVIPLLNFLVFIGFYVVMALPGTKGPNKYGEDPIDPVSASTFE
ncbi:hypothetical protein GCM10023115_23360 [Pontixanthobacter gangjinensis]|uniref:DUF805 domain-containing protein n=1 Tax=Pontixanthobacter gangjinensis TaxID=1028742 RepID=A0A6I4SNS1_9SPHN|nr:DUF805 domain-containing protein [Pontixanthobacter gangjinensis]MXO57581.1 DUF805 domain-containing protein [Pontixanthobacter gangjinensis]